MKNVVKYIETPALFVAKRILLPIIIKVLILVASFFSLSMLFLIFSGENEINADDLQFEQIYFTDRFICSHPEADICQTVVVYITEKDECVTMSLEEFTVCSLYTEMSYLSNPEALMAQAVAIRSYCLYKTEHRCEKHPQADVCDNYSHCLGFRSKEDIIKDNGEENAEKILSVLWETVNNCKGEYLSYNGEYANAMFHDSSNGMTESYFNLYGKNLPYLVSVESREEVPTLKTSYSIEELINKLFDSSTEYDIFSPVIGECKYHENSERVKSICIFGKEFDSNTLRFALGLNSTCFTVTQSAGRVMFTSYGFGHGIGLSQRGAKEMADRGFDYIEILSHYYPGCTVENRNK